MVAAARRMLAQAAFPVRRVDPHVESVGRRPVEMHLADGRGLVIQVAEPFAQGEHLVGETRRELRHADGVRELPRDQRLPARRAERRVAIRPLEQRPCRASASRFGVARRGSPSIPSVQAAWSSAMIRSRLGRVRPAAGSCRAQTTAALRESSERRARTRGSIDLRWHEHRRVVRLGSTGRLCSRISRQTTA